MRIKEANIRRHHYRYQNNYLNYQNTIAMTRYMVYSKVPVSLMLYFLENKVGSVLGIILKFPFLVCFHFIRPNGF